MSGLLNRIIRRILKLLTRTGYLIEEQGMCYLAQAESDRALTPLQAAACTYRIALGPQAGQKVRQARNSQRCRALTIDQATLATRGDGTADELEHRKGFSSFECDESPAVCEKAFRWDPLRKSMAEDPGVGSICYPLRSDATLKFPVHRITDDANPQTAPRLSFAARTRSMAARQPGPGYSWTSRSSRSK